MTTIENNNNDDNATISIYTNDELLINYISSVVKEIDIDISVLKKKLDDLNSIDPENIIIIKQQYATLKRTDVKQLIKKIKKFEELKARIDFMSVVIPDMYLTDLSYTLDIIFGEIKKWDSIICNDVNAIMQKINKNKKEPQENPMVVTQNPSPETFAFEI